jgi:predicted transcriptional regulator of viral defense system
MRPKDFFAQRSVFRLDELRAALLSSGERSPATVGAILKQHVGAGRLINVRRGLYAVVPPAADAASYRVDPFLVASRLTRDAVISHHAALEMLGKAYSGPRPRSSSAS